jgi:hypothetical protein
MESYQSDPVVGSYMDARAEYSRQLCQITTPAVFKLFMDLLDKARKDVGSDSHKTLYQYQVLLNELPDWNMEKVMREVGSLQRAIDCDYYEELLMAVFIAHTKVLSAIQLPGKREGRKPNIQLTIHKTDHFLFKVCCETAKLFWKHTYLFRDDIKNLERQQNYRQAEQLVNEAIMNTIRYLVPVKNILRECLPLGDETAVTADSDSDDSDNEDEEVAPVAPEAALSDAQVEPEEALVNAGADVVQEKTEVEVEAEARVEQPVAETITAVEEGPMVLTIDDEETAVKFAEYDTVFDGENSDLEVRGTGEIIGGELIIDESSALELDDLDEIGEDGTIKKAPVEEPVGLGDDDFDSFD